MPVWRLFTKTNGDGRFKMKIDEMEGRDPIKCDFCDLNENGHCGIFGMHVSKAVEITCHMDEDDYDIQWDVCCSYINGKVIPKCDRFHTCKIDGKNGMFGKCDAVGLVFYLRWFLGKKVCDKFDKVKPRQLEMGSLR